MSKIIISDVEFPLTAVKEMRYIRNYIAKELYHNMDMPIIIPNPGINRGLLELIRSFLVLFPEYSVDIILPRIEPVYNILPHKVKEWISFVKGSSLIALHEAAYSLGYTSLFELTSLVLSEG